VFARLILASWYFLNVCSRLCSQTRHPTIYRVVWLSQRGSTDPVSEVGAGVQATTFGE
jgi:hypothetical protein